MCHSPKYMAWSSPLKLGSELTKVPKACYNVGTCKVGMSIALLDKSLKCS